jgi:hypothetical protein
MEPMADPHVAAEVVAFSWRTRTDAALNPAFAPMLGHLMARYPESGKEFLSDLLEPAPPALSPGQVETVCRILIDMPDIGNWHQSALQILPRYGATAERLLIQDREGGDIEKQYRAQMWPAQLRGEVPGPVDQLSAARRRAAVRPLPDDNSGPSLHPLGSAASPRPAVGGDADPAANRPAPPVGDAGMHRRPCPAERRVRLPQSAAPGGVGNDLDIAGLDPAVRIRHRVAQSFQNRFLR